jgi:hypothetical protein
VVTLTDPLAPSPDADVAAIGQLLARYARDGGKQHPNPPQSSTVAPAH